MLRFSVASVRMQVLRVENCASAPMPRSDQVFASVLREQGNRIVVCEWAVPCSSAPCTPVLASSRMVRNYPCFAGVFEPTSAGFTRVSVVAVTSVASWMPHALVQDEMEKAVQQLKGLGDLPGTEDGQRLVEAVRAGVWKEAAKQMGPAAWSLLSESLPPVRNLDVTVGPPDHLPLMTSLGVFVVASQPASLEPFDVIAAARAFAESDGWAEKLPRRHRRVPLLRRDRKPREVELWTHQQPCAVRAACLVQCVHPMALALALTSEEFKRESDGAIVDLRLIEELGTFSKVWWQRSSFPGPMHDREMVYQSTIVDLSADHCVVCEWPVESAHHPKAPRGRTTVLARQLFYWDLRRHGNETYATVTIVVEVGGAVGWLRPLVDQQAESGAIKGMQELSGLFTTARGVEALHTIADQYVRGVCEVVARELTPLQLQFMEANAPGFAVASPSSQPQVA